MELGGGVERVEGWGGRLAWHNHTVCHTSAQRGSPIPVHSLVNNTYAPGDDAKTHFTFQEESQVFITWREDQ